LNPTSHIPQAKKAYSPSEPHVANVNPSRPNDNPEGEAKCYSLTLQFKGSFLFGFVDSHGRQDLDGTTGESAGDGVLNLSNPSRCAWVSGRIWRGCLGFRPDLANSSGFPTETHARHLSLAGYKEIRLEYHVFRPVLSSSIFLCRRSVCVGDGSLFLSPSLSPAGV